MVHVMMVGSWPCKVSYEIHINGRCVIEPVREDKRKMTDTELEDEKDLKRAPVVLSKGHEVVRPGYSRLTGAAAKVMDMGENSGNDSQVSKMEQRYLRRVSRVNQGNNTDRHVDQVSQVGKME
jgi:hypothetical protein